MPSTQFLIDIAARATVILAAWSLLALAFRRAAASSRYFLWTCALAAVLVLPVLSLVLPVWNVPVNMPVVTPPVVPAAAADAPADTWVAPAHTARRIPWPAAIWLAGALLVLARLAIGHIRLALMLRRARNGVRIGPGGAVRLKFSGETEVPLTCGIFTATVVLPDTAGGWDAERRQVVLQHELTHARRRDPLLWLLAQITTAVYWFHPLAWLAAAQFRCEQEHSCDDAVVNGGISRPAYARHLVELARSVAPHRTHAAALGMAATADLEQRVRALLDPRRNRRGLRPAACFIAIAAVAALLTPLAAVHAQGSGQTATLTGTVRDPSGAVIPGAMILLKNKTSREEAARADAAGEYRFSVPAGSYTLEVRAQGFAEFRKTIVLPADRLTNIAMALGQVSESMVVVGKGPLPPPQGTPHRIRVGGNVQATKLISMAKPVYPPGAAAAGIEGTVLLRAVISTSGDLLGLSAINTSVDGELVKAAMDAVKQWRYQPTLLNGLPVEVVTTIAITFRLEQ
ncbi:MAG TPA: M56 family metallopeptidase [Bryobacteraceae bacterium]|nr:M56 family metallopeptidase [Bryobacteraceae bacterium]